MPTFTYYPQFVCSQKFTIEHENGVIKKVEVERGCQGNLTGICHLLEGMKIEDAISRLEGIKCRGSRTGETSCPDQIAKALKQIL